MSKGRPGRVGSPPSPGALTQFNAWLRRLAIYVEELGSKTIPGAYTPLGYTQSNNSYHLVGNLDGVALDDGSLDGHILSVGNESGAWGVDHRELTSPDSTIGVTITGTAIELTLGTTAGMSDWEDLSQSLEAGDKFFLHDLSEDALYRLDYITLADAINSRAHYQYVQPVGGGLLPDHLILEFAAPLVPSDAAGDFATRVDFDLTALPLESNPVSTDYVLFYDSSVGANRKCTLADLGEGIDHGVLLGLGDDDHTQYHTDARALTWLGTRSLADLGTRSASDLSSGSLALARGGSAADLSSGAASNYLRGNAGGTAWEYRTPSQVLADVGAVGGRGNGVANRLALWSDADTITSDSNLTWDGSGVSILTVTGTGPIYKCVDSDTTGSGASGSIQFYDAAGTRSGAIGYSAGSSYVMSLYNQQAGEISLFTTATRRMTIAATGEVGIGVQAAAQPLEVRGATWQARLANNTSPTTNFVDIGANTSGHVILRSGIASPQFFFQGSSGSSGPYILFNSTSFDIASTSPRLRLFDLDTSGSGAQGYIEFYDSAATRSGYIGYISGSYILSVLNQQAGPINFSTSNTQRMQIDANGNIGMGANAPTNARLRMDYNPTDASVAQSSHVINFTSNYTSGGPNANYGVNATVIYGGSVGGSQINGGQFDCRANHSAGTVSDVRGVYGVVRSTSSAAVTTLTAARFDILSTAGATSSLSIGNYITTPTLTNGSVITTIYGFRADNQGNAAATTSYGLYLAAMSGSTTNWAIASLGGNSYHVGGLLIGVAGSASISPGRNLEVRDGSNPQQRWTQASGVGVEMQAIAGSGWSLTPLANASPGASSVNGVPASGNNVAGGGFDICAGRGTGTGLPGSLRLRSAPAGSSGSALNALATMLEIAEGNKLGLYGVAPVAQSTGWSISNPTSRKTIDVAAATLGELREFVGTLAQRMLNLGAIAA